MDHIDNLLRWMKGLPGTDTPHGLAAYKATAVLLGILIIWLLLKWFLQRLSRRLLRYPFFKENENVLKAIRKAVRYGLVIIAGTYIARLFELSLLEKIFQGVLIVMLAAPAKVVLIAALTYLEKNVADRTDNKVDDIIFDLLNRFSGAILYVTAIILALDIVGINVMPFIAGAGVAGIAIGFAAKDTLSNLIAGVLADYRPSVRNWRPYRGLECPGRQRLLGRRGRHRTAGHQDQNHRQYRHHHSQ